MWVKFRAREGKTAAKEEENEKYSVFFMDADVLIHDSRYTAVEFEKHPGWGHSGYDYSIGAAEKTGVKELVFFHHDPGLTGAELAGFEKHYRERPTVIA
ncbi:MAG: hypothetical protein LBQ67_03905 [Treponema sp.]|nr:hypothetical protein [Treponema sp.]